MKVYPSRMADQFTIRFPSGMRDQIKVMAAENERSMNAEIVLHLKRAIASEAETEKTAGAATPTVSENPNV